MGPAIQHQAILEPGTIVVSSFLQSASAGDASVIWHSLFGHPKIVSRETLRLLEGCRAPTLKAQLQASLDEGSRLALQELMDDFFLIPVGFDERGFLEARMREREASITDGSRIDFLELIMAETCNFRCTYCIHFNNLETSERINNPQKLMSAPMARNAVDRFLAILRRHGKRTATVNFGGGEPLLAWSVIEQVLAYCAERYGAEFEFRFSINTNASLITPEIAATLKRYHVEIASSLDGLKESNDRVRMTRSGKGTFASILKGFDTLAAVGHPLGGIAVTVNEQNFPELDERIIDWAAERQMIEVRIDIDVIDMLAIPLEEIVDRLMRIRRYAKEKGIEVAGFWSRAAENLNDSTLKADVAFCGAVRGNSMCISPSGNIYGCGYSTTQLGTLLQIKSFHEPESSYHRFVRNRLTGAMNMCRGCMIEGQCGGGCNITQEFARATASMKIERMCDFYRAMTRELVLEQLADAQAQA